MTRELDLVLWGATGYTGRLVARRLAQRAGALRWGLAGRDSARLGSVAQELGVDVPLVRADAEDAASMARLASSTRVVLSTVGPFARFGDALVDACVKAGTHCCDITGEVPWVRAVIDRHHERARERGLRLVSMCGYDSVPSDLGCLLLQEEVYARHGRYAPSVDAIAQPGNGAVSGGTIASAVHLLERRREPGVREHLTARGALTPGFTPAVAPDPFDLARVDGVWAAPFVMAGVNGRCVHRTHALLGHLWGEDFVYRERLWGGRGAGGWLRAAGLMGATAGFMAGMAWRPTRAFLRKAVLPAPGEGPSEERRAAGSLRHHLIASDGGRVLGRLRIEAALDPGYAATAVFLTECGLATLEPDLETAGALTPAYAFGPPLRGRLEAGGFRFEFDAPARDS